MKKVQNVENVSTKSARLFVHIVILSLPPNISANVCHCHCVIRHGPQQPWPIDHSDQKINTKKKTIYCCVVQAANLINSMHATMKIITRLQLDYARMDRSIRPIVCMSWIRFYDPPSTVTRLPLSRLLLIKYASRQQQQRRTTRILFV